MTEFQTHYLGATPVENKNLFLSAAQCQLDNENYDSTLPGYISRHGEWIPRSDYLGVSTTNARQNKEKYSLGFDKEEWLKAYETYSRFSPYDLDKEIAALKNS